MTGQDQCDAVGQVITKGVIPGALKRALDACKLAHGAPVHNPFERKCATDAVDVGLGADSQPPIPLQSECLGSCALPKAPPAKARRMSKTKARAKGKPKK